ncbi:low temperature requirement protein A, partial [Streptomyces cinereoruber]|uniref:low temperature requirement protein A n=1 Tax=Streptomyces cinereoruber TaxID=67260 RepID=UPI0036434D29
MTTPTRFSPLLRQMSARDINEEHRSATALELFFDLCFVVAVAQAGMALVHALAQGHVAAGVVGYLTVFFGIWWSWMMFTWFASAYDTDDVPYRLLTFVQMTGVLIYAAGTTSAFERQDWTVAYVGYLFMRLAMTAQWLRAARAEQGAARVTAYRFAAGMLLCQAGWTGLLITEHRAQQWLFLFMVIAELCVPVFASRPQRTAWHPRHIVERFGLFTLIVLGETVAAATLAVKSAAESNASIRDILPIAVGGLLIVFAAWWIYFAVPGHTYLTSNRAGFLWGYGHYVIFATAAAIGAGLEVAVEQATGHASIS